MFVFVFVPELVSVLVFVFVFVFVPELVPVLVFVFVFVFVPELVSVLVLVSVFVSELVLVSVFSEDGFGVPKMRTKLFSKFRPVFEHAVLLILSL